MKKVLLLLFLNIVSLPLFAFSQSDLVTQLQQPASVQGDFIQQRFLKSLPQAITTTGKFTLLKEKGLLWQMEKPFVSNTRINSKGVMQWNGSTWVGNTEVIQTQQIRLFLGLLSGDLSALSSQFSLKLAGSPQDWQLSLEPNNLLMKKIFNKIEISGAQVVTRVELQETQGDRTIIQLQNNQINFPLSPFAQTALQ